MVEYTTNMRAMARTRQSEGRISRAPRPLWRDLFQRSERRLPAGPPSPAMHSEDRAAGVREPAGSAEQLDRLADLAPGLSQHRRIVGELRHPRNHFIRNSQQFARPRAQFRTDAAGGGDSAGEFGE